MRSWVNVLCGVCDAVEQSTGDSVCSSVHSDGDVGGVNSPSGRRIQFRPLTLILPFKTVQYNNKQ